MASTRKRKTSAAKAAGTKAATAPKETSRSKSKARTKETSKAARKSASKSASKPARTAGISRGQFARHAAGAPASADATVTPLPHCHVPVVAPRALPAGISPFREQLIRDIEKRWVNGTVLHYYFFTTGPYAGAAAEMQLVRDAFDIWRQVGIGISFTEVDQIEDAEVRIGFLAGDGAWSFLGRDVIDIPGQQERTMNFGWSIANDRRGVDVAVHEIGHTLGFPHEHQNPIAGIVWDEPAVYRLFGGPPNNWPHETTFHNVLRKLPHSTVEGSAWDPDSIMHYAFPGGLILEPEAYRNGVEPAPGLSAADLAEVRRLYPPLDDEQYPALRPFQLESLAIGPGEQRNYLIEPDHSRKYTIQTVGQSDTLLVLFEEVDGDLAYLAGDDDSGTDYNAQIELRLHKGKRYVLRVRLYLNYTSGDTAILLS